MWMNATLACIAVISMLTARTLWGALVVPVELDMKEMGSLVKVYSRGRKCNNVCLLHPFHPQFWMKC